jgi:hypothetical protein
MKVLSFNNFDKSQEDRLNSILDRISKYGMESLAQSEREFLDKYSKENDGYYRVKLSSLEFIFDLDKTSTFQDEFRVYGSVFVNGLRFDGSLVGFPTGDGFGGFIFKKRNGEDFVKFGTDLGDWINDNLLDYELIQINDWFRKIWTKFLIKYGKF